MSHYTKGRAAEYRTMRVLEMAGYVCARTAGSHGPFDVVAVMPGRGNVRLINVKCGAARATPAEREALARLCCLPHVAGECWHWPARSRVPVVREVGWE